jgi:hypothetical protein
LKNEQLFVFLVKERGKKMSEKEIILRDTPEAPRNDPFSDERLEGLHESTSILAKEFSVLLNPKAILTPHLCRKGCKHYDSVGNPKSGELR